ncbi:MAG TPA: ATP-binding protein [Rubricoccaceae bacterium]|jgi:PAS domain S-box-containing protein
MLALLLVALALAGPHAGSPHAGSPPADPRADANRDAVPDGVGQTVTVAGRALVASGRLGGGIAFFLQDARGGVRISRPMGPPVARGDSVVATGRLSFRDGVAELDRPHVRVIPGGRRVPAPAAYTASRPEAVEGRLVTVEAVVSSRNPVAAGTALLLTLADGSLLVAFAYADRPEAMPLNGYMPGDHVRITGIAGQYDRAAPYRDSYQIYPRTAGDIQRVDLPAIFYRSGALALLCLFGLAVLWGATMRRQVARRVAELARSDARYRMLVERASDAVIVHDLSGRHAELNSAARRALGLAAGSAVSALHHFVDAADREALKDHAAALATSGQARTDLCVCRTDGTQSIYEVESQTLVLDGRTRVLSLARDVGARRAHEAGLIEAREAAEEALRVKSAFLASMSHEIRTPLTAVIGFAELLREEVSEEQLDLVASIEHGGHRLLATLNSVLDLARLDARQETLRPAPVDLVAHIGSGVRLFDALAAKKGLALVYAPSVPALPAVVDAGALDRVLINLLGNAVKFTDAGRITVAVGTRDGGAVLTVTDTGIGMAAEFLPALFDEFRQASEGEARSHEGTGLGMSITQKLVGLMGGTISVESAPGVGTTFEVAFPLGAEPGVPSGRGQSARASAPARPRAATAIGA